MGMGIWLDTFRKVGPMPDSSQPWCVAYMPYILQRQYLYRDDIDTIHAPMWKAFDLKYCRPIKFILLRAVWQLVQNKLYTGTGSKYGQTIFSYA